MDLYLLAELKTISLKVTTVDMLKPPPDFRSKFDSTPPPILIDRGEAVLENDKIERYIMKSIPGGHNLFVSDKETSVVIEDIYTVSDNCITSLFTLTYFTCLLYRNLSWCSPRRTSTRRQWRRSWIGCERLTSILLSETRVFLPATLFVALTANWWPDFSTFELQVSMYTLWYIIPKTNNRFVLL